MTIVRPIARIVHLERCLQGRGVMTKLGEGVEQRETDNERDEERFERWEAITVRIRRRLVTRHEELDCAKAAPRDM